LKTTEKLNKSKVPVLVFDKKLEQYRDLVLFPEKVEKAKENLAKVGLPKYLKK
jgi:hypothetical protein